MNYGYIFVDSLNGHSYEDGFSQLKYSIKSLKDKKQEIEGIYVFNNESEGRNIEFFNQQNINHKHISLSRNYNKSDDINPLNILVEKIISLMNFDEDKELVIMDIDTSLTQKIPHDYWDENYIVFDALEYPIMQWRNLDKVLPNIPWKQFDINFDDSFMMYNTGVIYLPKKFRKEICEKALSIVDYLNENFDPDERYGNKLDEQIALSIVAHDCYGKFGNIKFSNEYIHHYWKEKQEGINWWTNSSINETLPLSVGILAWNSGETLRNTLSSYEKNGLFNMVNDVTLFFQEVSENDIKIANEYNLPFIAFDSNIGIGNAFVRLAEVSESENILLLEHDWELIENKETTYKRLKDGIDLLDSGFNCIKYRHRRNPGFPLYSLCYKGGQELIHYSDIIKLDAPHLFECVHWIQNPHLEFPDKIQKEGDYFVTTSRWANFTNNPCMYKKKFYIDSVKPFINESLLLENDIIYWWARKNFKVSHGEGLFSHNDILKHGYIKMESLLN